MLQVRVPHRLLPRGLHEVLQQGPQLRQEPRPPRRHRDGDEGGVSGPALQLPAEPREAVRDVGHQDGARHHRHQHGDGQRVRPDQDLPAPGELQGPPGGQEDGRLRRVPDPLL